MAFGGSDNHPNPNQTGPTSLPPSSSPGLFGGSCGGGGNHPNPNQTGPPSPGFSPGLNFPTILSPSSSPGLFGVSGGGGNHQNPSQTRPPSPGFSTGWSPGFSTGWSPGWSPGFGFPKILSPSKTNQSFFESPFKNADMSRESPFKNGDMSRESPVGSFPARTTTIADGNFIVNPKFMGGSLTVSPEEEAFKSRTPSSSLTHLSPPPQPKPPLCFPHEVAAAAACPSSSSLTPSPVQDSGFEDEISSMTAEKASILRAIKQRYPSCLSSLRLRSKPHRQAAYDHLFQVVQDLRAICGGNGGLDLCDKVLTSLDDLEIYGFSMGWLREEVVQLRRRRMAAVGDKEAKLKLREALMKRIKAIDAELAALKTKLPFNSDGEPAAAPAKLFLKTYLELQT